VTAPVNTNISIQYVPVYLSILHTVVICGFHRLIFLHVYVGMIGECQSLI